MIIIIFLSFLIIQIVCDCDIINTTCGTTRDRGICLRSMTNETVLECVKKCRIEGEACVYVTYSGDVKFRNVKYSKCIKADKWYLNKPRIYCEKNQILFNVAMNPLAEVSIFIYLVVSFSVGLSFAIICKKDFIAIFTLYSTLNLVLYMIICHYVITNVYL